MRGIGVVLSAMVVNSAFAAPGDNAVGINVHHLATPIADAAADLNVGWVRVDGNWFQMEPADDQYSWGSMDGSVAAANARGLSVYMTLAYTPQWVARHGDTDGRFSNDTPNASTDWEAFVRAAVTRYRGQGVTHFGIWNEPNLEQFFEGTVQEYATLIAIPGAAAVRAVCNDCVVLGPDLAHVGAVDDYLEQLLGVIPLSTFDIFAHHIYGGFPETGTQIWDGDRFFNSLDMQRFSFTRRSLRQILDAAGWTGEVWITETGYRADPGNASEEMNQAIYVRRVLEEQLARAWYTNTFFYEMLDCRPFQATCDIDGFGIVRSTGATDLNNMQFPGDFRLKPAYDALKQFIAQNPQLSGTAPAVACGDGQDNDNDGRTDMEDRGCAGAVDNDESDDPPRLSLSAYRTPGIVVDGDLSDFGPDGWVRVGPSNWRGTEPLGAGDLDVRVAARWSQAGLHLAFDVTDDVQENDHTPADSWQGDSVQLAFDVGQTFGDAYDNVDDHEINLALLSGQPSAHRFHGPAGATAGFNVAVSRSGAQTRYEVLLPSAALPTLTAAAGTTLGFSFLVNDDDGTGRAGWIEWTPGIGTTKAPYWFGEITLAATQSPPPSGADAGIAADANAPDALFRPDAVGADSSGFNDSGSVTSDARITGSDAAVGRADASAAGPAPTTPPQSDGCGCATTPRQPGLTSFLLFGLLVLTYRCGRSRVA